MLGEIATDEVVLIPHTVGPDVVGGEQETRNLDTSRCEHVRLRLDPKALARECRDIDTSESRRVRTQP